MVMKPPKMTRLMENRMKRLMKKKQKPGNQFDRITLMGGSTAKKTGGMPVGMAKKTGMMRGGMAKKPVAMMRGGMTKKNK
jgi:hypothetical protein